MNKKGFTLIELLAVIVVLSIVMVLATTTVLPLIGDARQNAFGVEATAAIQAAEDAFDLYKIGQYELGETSGTSCKVENNVYCWTVEELINSGRLDADKTTYFGTVTIDNTGDTYKYELNFQKKDEFVIIGGDKKTYKDDIEESLGNVSDWVVSTHQVCSCEE